MLVTDWAPVSGTALTWSIKLTWLGTEGTGKVSIHTTQIEGQVVRLIDTPGFDDKDRSDEDTFHHLVYWLIAAYEQDLRFTGIVIVHRLTDPRLQRSAQRALKILKAMCGHACFKGIVVATTVWDGIIDEDFATTQERQGQLAWGIFSDVLRHSEYLMPLRSAEADAPRIIRHIVQKKMRLTLAIQEELVGRGLTLEQTAAGKLVLEDLLQAIVSVRVSGQEQLEEATLGVSKAFHAKCAELNHPWKEHRQQDSVALAWDAQTYLSFRTRLEELETYLVNSQRTTEGPMQHSIDSQAGNSDTRCIVTTPMIASSSKALLLEIEQLKRQYESVVRYERHARARKGYLTRGRGTTTLGVVGTGLAVGQFVAAMACNVMWAWAALVRSLLQPWTSTGWMLFNVSLKERGRQASPAQQARLGKLTFISLTGDEVHASLALW
jgi:hypothetical protein